MAKFDKAFVNKAVYEKSTKCADVSDFCFESGSGTSPISNSSNFLAFQGEMMRGFDIV